MSYYSESTDGDFRVKGKVPGLFGIVYVVMRGVYCEFKVVDSVNDHEEREGRV